MFKRVGSIVLSIVMMLTMVCSTFALDYDPMGLAVRVDGDITEAKPGDQVTVYVDLTGHPGAIGAITVLGTYNTEAFELQAGDITPAAIGDGGFIATPILDVEDEEEQIRVNWVAMDNVTVEPGNLLELNFTVKEDAPAGDATFSFEFLPEGMTYFDGEGNPAYLVADSDYVAAPAVSDPIEIQSGVLASLFAGINGTSSVAIGDTVEVFVQVNDYQDDWAGLVVEGTYDKDLFELTAVNPESLCENDAIIVRDEGKVSVGFISQENIVSTEDSVVLFSLVFTAKAAGEASFNFSFKDGGVVSVGTDNVYVAKFADTDYVKAAEPVEIEVTEVAAIPGLTIEQTGETEVTVGEDVNVEIGLDNYNGKWASLGIKIAYDPAALQVSNVTPNPFGAIDAVVIYKDGEILITWISESNIATAPEAMAFATFKSIAAGDTTVSVDYIDNSIVSIGENGEYISLVEDTDYVVTTGSVDVAIEDVIISTTPSLDVTVENDLTEVEEGAEINVIVDLKGYNNNWAALTVEGSYDKNLFELTNIATGAFGSATAVPVRNDAEGKLSVAWINDSNVVADADSNLLILTFKAIAEGEGNFNFNFKEGGVLSIGENGEYNTLVKDTDYIEAAEEVTVEVTERQPNAAPNLTVDVAGDVTTVEKGETVTVTVNVNEYADDWAGFTIEGAFNKDLFELTTITPATFGENAAVTVKDNENGKLSAAWMSATNVDGELEFTALTLVFTAKAAGVAEFNFNFKDEGIVTIGEDGAYITLQPEIDYVKDAEPVEITVTDSTPVAVLKPTISVKDGQTVVQQGETITLIVGVENYTDLLTGITINGAFDANVFELTESDIVAENLEGMTVVPIVDAANNMYKVTIMGATGYDANASSFKLFEVTLTAKADADLGATDLGVVFVADGMADANGDALAAEKFDLLPQSVTVTIAESDECQHDWSGKPAHKEGTSGEASKHVYTCANNCGETKEEACTVVTVKTPAKCGVAGTINYSCAVCGYNETITDPDAPALDHDFSGKPVHKDGTTGENSKHIYTCGRDNCEETKEESCNFSEINRVPADCDTAEKITYKCADCDYEYTVDGDPATGHAPIGVPVHKDGTTGESSKHIFTCANGCGESVEEDCTFSSEVFKPTCGEQGHTTYTCTGCGFVYTGNYVPALPAHTHVVTAYYAADRTAGGANGWIDEYCYGCNDRVGENPITIIAGQVFPDVSTTAVESAWYYDAVAFCKAFGIFGGDEKGNFNPTQNITRGQMVTVLGRMMMPEAEKQMSASAFNAFLASQGSMTSTPSTNSLSDVSGMYYERYAKLLAKWGIVTGYEDGTFRGDNPITRQEMATLLKRFVEAYAGTANVQFGNAATFADMSKVDSWAKANVQWAGNVGLFQGDQNKNYNPHSNATRAEIAVVISRMLPVLDGIDIIRMTGNV